MIGTVSLTGTGIIGYSAEFQKTVSATSGNSEFDEGPLVIPVSTGESLTLLASLLTGAGSADADYNSTDHVYITPLTPGLQIISAGGHDYSFTSTAAPEPASAALFLFGLSGLIIAARRW